MRTRQYKFRVYVGAARLPAHADLFRQHGVNVIAFTDEHLLVSVPGVSVTDARTALYASLKGPFPNIADTMAYGSEYAGIV